jgi:hypothetical protein
MTSAFFAQLDATWLTERLDGRKVSSFTFDETDMEKLNKTSGLRFAKITFADGGCTSLVFKISASTTLSMIMGLGREAIFYQKWSQLERSVESRFELGTVLARVYHAEGSMETGEKVIVMDDLSVASPNSVQLGILFGNGNPNNWGKDLEGLVGKLQRPVDVEQATRLAFSAAAKLHAPFWGCRELTKHSWLRSSGWLEGRGREDWLRAQNHTATQWAQVKANLTREDYKVKWDPFLVECLDAAIEKVWTVAH